MDFHATITPGIARRTLPLVALATAAVLAFAACTSSGAGASPSGEPRSGGPALEGTAWQLTDYVGPEGGTVAVPEAVAATATFADGKVSGNAGCNQYNGTYTLDGDKLAIGDVSTTMMACPGARAAVETAYLAALGKVATYAIAGETLELRTAEGAVGLRYKVAVAPSLTKTRWVANTINNGKGGAESVVADSTVTAVFAEDGTVAGSGGCNTYSGTYTVDGTSLSFGPLASTQMACADEALSQQEASFFAALERVSTYAFDGDNLELRDADGALQARFEPTLP